MAEEATTTTSHGRHPLVLLFSLLFGIGAWVSINGMWVELPLLVSLPEGWALPSYLSVIIQIANIGPISYSASKILYPNAKPALFIYLVLAIGCLSSLLLAIFWQNTSYIGGELHSTALLILVFFLAIVDCTSSVLYLPYMGLWKTKYLPFYSIGEGLSGLIPALVALAQGVGNSGGDEGSDDSGPNFSVSFFFVILFGMMVVSSLAFILLDKLPSLQFERSVQQLSSNPQSNQYTSTGNTNLNQQIDKIPTISSSVYDKHEDSQAAIQDSTSYIVEDLPSTGTESTNSLLVDENGNFEWPKRTFQFLILTQLFAALLTNGFLPSVQSYSCAPYGDRTYHLVATLTPFANPLAAITTVVSKRARPTVIAVMLGAGTVLSVYLIVAAAMSPNPPLVGTTSGSVMIITFWITYTYLMSFVHVETNNLLRLTGSTRGHNVLFLSGAATQSGSFIGAVTAFVLVNVAKVFKS